MLSANRFYQMPRFASGARGHRITLNDLFHDPSDQVLFASVQKMSANCGQIGNVANVITDAIGGIVRIAPL